MPVITEITEMQDCFNAQRIAYDKHPYSSYQSRNNKLRTLKRHLIEQQNELAQAINEDFGCRNTTESTIVDLMTVVSQINYTLKHLKRWMKPQRRSSGILAYPATAEVHYQPKGVIGIITPWNYPVFLSVGPMVTAIAAGNRTMIKMSEFTPHTNKAVTALIESCFAQDEVAIVEGELEISQAFSKLQFDHILFTGSTNVGKAVMSAAAENLVPVTLELGGKSPCILLPDFSAKRFARDVLLSKTLNSGQTCVAPDTLYCHRAIFPNLIAALKAQYQTNFPDQSQATDITSLIHDPHMQRMKDIVADAEDKGAKIYPLTEAETQHARQMPLTVLTDCTPDMRVMQEEIFGPLLPVVLFDSLDEVMATINAGPRPLALYAFTHDINVQRQLLYETHSGGVCFNDAAMQVGVEDLPFGGIGDSGMGCYHAEEGFRAFSHAKAVLSRGRVNMTPLFGPPYGRKLHDLLLKLLFR
ncbi:MAG: coniferyl aldehyde dehydrogenase [Gammaproteobacteria bacterium]